MVWFCKIAAPASNFSKIVKGTVYAYDGNVSFGSKTEIAINKAKSKITGNSEQKLSQYESRLSTDKEQTKYYEINEATKSSKSVARKTKPKGKVIYRGGLLDE